MTRKLDQASRDALKGREGCRLTAYRDEGGIWTIGWGETDGVTEGMTITQERADAWFDRAVVPFEQAVEEAVKVQLSDNQFGALVSFCYNVGTGKKGVSNGFVVLKNGNPSGVLKAVNELRFADVPEEMLHWVNVNGVRDPGLVNRRNSEGGQWVKGAYVRGAAVTPDAPPPWWKSAKVAKIGAAATSAATSAYSHVSSDSISKAADAAQSAAQHWHQFGTVAGVLSAALILWLLVEKK